MICFIALVIYRILKRWLDYKYTTKEVFDTLRNTNVHESKDDGYFPNYRRCYITDIYMICLILEPTMKLILIKILKGFNQIK